MELDVWISHEGNKITKWEGGDWAKDTVKDELAEARSPYFPNGHEAFSIVTSLYNSGEYETGCIDYLTKYVMLPKSEIINIIKKLHCNLPHINERLDELEKYVENLPEKSYYKVIQQEF